MTKQQATRLLLATIIATLATATADADSKKIATEQPPLQAEIIEDEILVEYKNDTLPPLVVRPDVRPNNIPSQISPNNTPPPAGLPLDNKIQTSHFMLNQLMKGRTDKMNEVAKDIQKRLPIMIRSNYPALGVQLWKIGKGKIMADVIASLLKEPSVRRVSPNYKIYPENCPHPPSNSPQCDPPTDGHWRAGRLWGMEKIGMKTAWKLQPEHEVVVAVLDSGIDYLHPDLAHNMWVNPGENRSPDNVDDDKNGFVDDIHGVNFCSQKPEGNPMDRNGHGTMVAGIIAAHGNNWDGTVTSDGNGDWLVTKSETGLVGVNYKAKLMALKILCSSTDARESSIALAIQAIDYAWRHGAKVLNNSWGLSGAPESELEILKEAIRRSNCELEASSDANCQPALFVASAGNNRSDNDTRPHYPSSFNNLDNVIAVAASNIDDGLWSESGGGSGGSNWGIETVDIAAPGTNILSTYLRNEGNGTDYMSGTSMAAPHVSGCAVLLLGKSMSTSSALLPKNLKTLLMTTGDKPPTGDLPSKVRSERRLNCQNALPH